MNLINKKAVFCQVCGECLGEYKENYAKEHLHKHPSHNNFFVMKIVDPLSFSNLDEWLNIRITNMKTVYQPTGNIDKTTDDETEP